MKDELWRIRQMELMESSYDDLDTIISSEDPLQRVLLFAAEKTLYDAHQINLVATYPANAHFRLLDLGCGDGRVAHAIAQRYPNADIVGIDPLPQSFRLAASLPPLPNLKFVLAGFEEITEMAPFDFVICSEVYEHVIDTTELLKTIQQSLRPDGLLSLSTPSGWMARAPRLTLLKERMVDRDKFRLRRWPERAWAEALELHPGTRFAVLERHLSEAGFDVLHRGAAAAWVDPASRSMTYLAQTITGVRPADRSFLFAVCRALARGDGREAARRLYHFFLTLEGLMNLFPILRPLESRMVVLAKRGSDVTRG